LSRLLHLILVNSADELSSQEESLVPALELLLPVSAYFQAFEMARLKLSI
jgi:hypothetical protein